jgi:hypothetical protein
MSAVLAIQVSLGVAAIVFLLKVLLQSNFEKFIEDHQWNSLLTLFVRHVQERKSFWFLFGLLSGAWIISVILPYVTAGEPYVDPIHDSQVKWNIVKWYTGGDNEQCHIVIVSLPVAYAEDYARDWKEIFTALKWPVTERFADTPLEKGVTLRPIQADAKAVACAKMLNTAFSDYALNKRGSTGGQTYINSYQGTGVPTYLIECTSPCVELDLGNEKADQ